MKYKTELIHDILETRGHEKSSLHYESECVESWIDEAKGAYPKLCDYESEWLNYIKENPVGDFPYETVTNVTDATINNVVPYAYKSAILKGQTLVNLFKETNRETAVDEHYLFFKIIGRQLQSLKPNTQYTLIYDNYVDGISTVVYESHIDGLAVEGYQYGQKFTFTTIENVGSEIHLFVKGDTLEIAQKMLDLQPKVVIIEGNHTQEYIPYFEGMQSVKMPVLTTTGKNLLNFNSNNVDKYYGFDAMSGYGEKKGIEVGKSSVKFTKTASAFGFVIKDLIPNTKYVLSYDVDNNSTLTLNNNYIAWKKHIFTTDGNGNSPKLSWGVFSNNTNNGVYIIYNIQIEEGSTATSYEPHKSNILSTSEDVELRGIGEVQDTLDLKTGEMVERVGEAVLDGSERIVYHHQTTDQNTLRFFINCFGYNTGINTSVPFLTDSNLPKKNSHSVDEESIFSSWGALYIRIAKEKLTENSVKGFKLWLSQNPITIQYQLVTSIVKTVDLSVVNQDGNTTRLRPIEGTMHISTSSETINPLFSGEIPVEAITQNLASFIEEE